MKKTMVIIAALLMVAAISVGCDDTQKSASSTSETKSKTEMDAKKGKEKEGTTITKVKSTQKISVNGYTYLSDELRHESSRDTPTEKVYIISILSSKPINDLKALQQGSQGPFAMKLEGGGDVYETSDVTFEANEGNADYPGRINFEFKIPTEKEMPNKVTFTYKNNQDGNNVSIKMSFTVDIN